MDRRRLPRPLLLGLALAALTIAVYAPVVSFKFLNYDDYAYVLDNAHVASGVSLDNLRWAMTAFENGNWHPLTLAAHMLDVQVFGLNAGAHHAVNLVLHVANVLLLFWLFTVATAQPWPAALVAALFAIHPLNVQTVAWIAERKSLLSTAFWLLALLAHVRYRKERSGRSYALVVALAALALSAKPMAVTLPLTLVLFDVWPLAAKPRGRGSRLAGYARELAPFLILAALCGVLTLAAQGEAHALQSVTAYDLKTRLANAVVAYVWYLKSMIWPAGLAAFYPHPMTQIATGAVSACLVVLLVICSGVIAAGRRFPAAAMGWWWYVGTMLPVVGIIQVGSQAYADRYAYVPLVGIFVIIAWSLVRVSSGVAARWRRLVAGLAVVWIASLALVTRAQLPYWRDSVALFERAIEVVPDNALAHNNLGMALVERRQIPEALPHFERAVAIAPWDTDARSNMANALRALGRPAEAAAAYAKALEQAPDDASIHYNLATALADLSRWDEATVHLIEAIRLDPRHVRARLLLGTMLYKQGRSDEALAQFREVARLDPADPRAQEWVRRIEAAGGR